MFSSLNHIVVLVVVPHQDDEICLMGGFLPLLAQSGCNVHVCYVTDGAFYFSAELRHNEAKQALAVLGVSDGNIHFCDVPDGNGPEMPVQDFDCLRQYIINLHPDVIFATDKDNHVDHMMVSNVVDEIVSQLDYKPAYFKGFAYSTAFNAPKDYYSVNLLSTKEPESLSPVKVPYIWEKRIRMPVADAAAVIPLRHNLLFRSIYCHRCQLLRGRSRQLINGDVVFWQIQGGDFFQCAKILIDDHFTYGTYNILEEQSVTVGIYVYGIDRKMQVMCDGKKLGQISSKIDVSTLGKCENIVVQLVDENDSNIIHDQVTIHRLSNIEFARKRIGWWIDHFRNYSIYAYDMFFKYFRWINVYYYFKNKVKFLVEFGMLCTINM